jgi:hypothetical protein
MSEFKVGQKYRKVIGINWADSRKKVATVSEVSDNTVWFDDNVTFYRIDHAVEELVLVHDNYPNPPHVHCDLIKEWADGAVIQVHNTVTDRWEDTSVNKPKWTSLGEYRVKLNDLSKKEKLLVKIAELTAQVKELD